MDLVFAGYFDLLWGWYNMGCWVYVGFGGLWVLVVLCCLILDGWWYVVFVVCGWLDLMLVGRFIWWVLFWGFCEIGFELVV